MGRGKIRDKRICSNCSSDKTYMKLGRYAVWYNSNEGYLCSRCKCKLVYEPHRTKTKEAIKKYNDRNNFKILVFKDRRILLKENPRKGVCSWCGAVKGIGCKRTHMHHKEYHKEDVLKDTIELCDSCHSKEHARLKKEK